MAARCRSCVCGLRSLAWWYCRFESPLKHESLSPVNVVCCHVKDSASGWSLAQRIPTDCDMSQCDRETSITRTPWPTGGCCAMEKRNYLQAPLGLFFKLVHPCLASEHAPVDLSCLNETDIAISTFPTKAKVQDNYGLRKAYITSGTRRSSLRAIWLGTDAENSYLFSGWLKKLKMTA